MKKITKQPFDYYLFLDFEANCLENDETFFREIIEFPIVMVNSSTLEIEKEFKTFVKPTVNKEITEFCTNLTGITQVIKIQNEL
jgi:inhibitor of KinA sporulation pathway (predicted exonuclease)